LSNGIDVEPRCESSGVASITVCIR
jgi:hypothetical protein